MKKAFAAFCALAFLAQQCGATTFTVTSMAGDCSSGTLCAQIEAANAAGGTNTIVFSGSTGGTINLSASLPVVSGNVTIDASGAGSAITINGQGQYQVFTVGGAGGTVSATIENMTVENGLAQGGNGGSNTGSGGAGGGGGLGAGGGLFVNSNANVTLVNVAFDGNKAQGGNGGSGATSINTGTGAGGGGFNGGNGGSTTGLASGGGGGWGLGASGGNDAATANGGAGECAGPSCASGGNGKSSAGGANGGGGGVGGGAGLGAGGGGVSGGAATIQNGGGVGGNGGFGGGGGGGPVAGAGGFGGGGGGAASLSQGAAGAGGFGGGGGGGGSSNAAGGFGGGNGDASGGNGGGGAGLGGAIFVNQGGTISIENGGIASSNSAAAGAGGGGAATAGAAAGGAIFLSNGAAAAYQVDNGQTSAIASTIAGQGSDGGVVKNGAGTLNLSANNTYTGGTVVNAGTLGIVNDDNLGAVSGVLTLNGGTLQTQASLSSARAITLQSGGGTIDTDGNNAALSGGINGSGSLAKAGAGTLTLSGANGYAGGTFIGGGTLSVGDAANLGGASAGGITFNGSGGTLQTTGGLATSQAVTLSAAGTVDAYGQADAFSGQITGGGGLTVTDSSGGGGGKVTLTGASNLYTGGTTVENGAVLGVTSDGALGATGPGNGLALNNGTLQTQAGLASARSVSLGAGGGTVDADANDSTLSGTISGGGALTVVNTGASAGVLTLANSGANTYSGGTTVSGANATLAVSNDNNLGAAGLTLNNGGTLETLTGLSSSRVVALSGTGGALNTDANSASLSGLISGGGALTVNGGGTLTLADSSANTYSGGTVVSGANTTLAVSNFNNLGTGGLTLAGGGAFETLANGLSSNIAVTLGSGGGTLNTNTNTETLSGAIGGAGALTVDGGGTLTLADSSANAYSGGTIVNNATLALANDNNLGTGSLTLSGGTLETQGAVVSARAVTLSGGATIDTDDNASAFSGAVGGVGGLTVNDSTDSHGKLSLSGTNSYTGGTIVENNATLGVASDASLGAAGAGNGLALDAATLQTQGAVVSARAVTIAGGAAIDADGQASSFSGPVTGSGGLTVTDSSSGGKGKISLSGVNGYTGGTVVEGSAVLGITNDVSLGAASGGLTLDNGTLQAQGNLASSRAVTLGAGGGTFDTDGNASTLGGLVSGGALTVVGSGSLALGDASNNYSGGTTVNAATLVLGNDAALGTGGLTLANGGTLQTTSGLASSRAITLAGSGGAVDTDANSSTLSGMIGGAGALSVNGGGVLTLSGANDYAGGTTVSGATLKIAADSALGDASGALTINGGTLQTQGAVNASRAVAIAGGAAIDADGQDSSLSGPITGSGGLTITDSSDGGGKISLANASNDYSGGTTVENTAVLGIVNASSLGAGGLTLKQGGLQLQSNVSAGLAMTLNSNGAGTGGTIDTDGNTSTLSGSIGGNGELFIKDSTGGNGMLTLSGANSYSGGTELDSGVLSVSNDGNLGAASGGLTINGATLQTTGQGFSSARAVTLGAGTATFDTDSGAAAFSGPIGGSGALLAKGGGTLLLSGINDYSGGTTVAGNTTLAISNGAALGSGALTINGGTLQTQASLLYAQAITLGSGGGAGGGTVDTDGFSSTLSGTIGGGALTKINGGTLLLQGANTYQGGTNINGGILAVTSDGNLGNAAGALTFDGGTLQTQAAVSSARAVTIGSLGATVDTDGNNATLSGTIGGTGALTKVGAGTLALGDSSNGYSGGTTISQGTLSVLSDGALGAASGGLTFNGGTLQTAAAVSSGRGVTLAAGGGAVDTDGNGSALTGAVIGNGALTVLDSTGGNGTLTLSGVNTYTGGTVLDSGILSVASNASLGSGALTFNGGELETTADLSSSRNITINSGDGIINVDPNTTSLSGQIGGAGALLKLGAGTLVLSGANSYAGGTFVDAGTLGITNSSSLGTGSLSINGGTLQTAAGIGDFSRSIAISGGAAIDVDDNGSTFSGAIGGGGGLTVTDSTNNGGKLSLLGVNGYAGGTTVNNNATLAVAGDAGLGAEGAGNGLTLSGGTLQTLSSLSSARSVTLGASGGTFDTDGNTAALSGTITGAGALNKIGAGTLILEGAGNNYSGGTNVNAGILELAANNALPVGGALTVAGGATLNAGGFTQTIGSYSGNGTIAVSPQSATAANIIVTGNAALSGTTLSVSPANPQLIQNGQTFKPIQVSGGGTISGSFSNVVSPVIELAYAPTYDYVNNDVVVTASLIPLANFAATRNQAAVAEGLESIRAQALSNSDAAAVVAGLYSLNQGQLQSAFDQIGPISLAAMSGVGFAASGLQSAAVAQRMAGLQMADPDSPADSFAYYKVSGQSSSPGAVMAYGGDSGGASPAASSPEGRWSVFASGVDTLGRLGSQNGPGGAQPGYDFNAGGATFGSDYRFNEHYVAGLSAGYISGNATVDSALGSVSNQSLRYGAYGTAYNGAFHANLYAGGAHDAFITNRNVDFEGVSRTATAMPSGDELDFDASGGYDVRVSHAIVSPFADLAYDSLTIAPFDETGAQSLDLNVARQTAQSMRASVGAKVTGKFVKSQQTTLLPYVSLGMEHEFDDQSRAIGAQFAGTGAAFAVTTADVARNGVLIGTGLTVDWGSGFSTKLDYAGDFRSNFNAQSLEGALRYQF